MKKILCICLSSTIQKTINFKQLQLSEVNRSVSYRMDASGKALNSARVLNQLEKNCVLSVCPLGQKNKDLFLELAERDELALDYVLVPGFTRECWTLLNNEDFTTTELVVGEPNVAFDVSDVENKLLKIIDNKIKDVDGVLFAGSKPVYFSENIIPAIARLALDNKKIFLADYHGRELLNTLKVCIPSIIKINESEFIETFNLQKDSNGKCSQSVLKNVLIEKSLQFNNIIIITRGSQSTYACNKGIFVECPVEKVVAVNTTACGDSFSAGFIYEYLNNGDFDSCLKKGTWCAARNAQLQTPGAIR